MNETQTSETMKLGAVITLAGGFMDAYSYICRGKVFANAQTGNLLLLGIKLFERKWGLALSYCIPVVAFSMGIIITEAVQYLSEKRTIQKNVWVHWKQITLLLEILSLITVCLFRNRSICWQTVSHQWLAACRCKVSEQFTDTLSQLQCVSEI